MDIYVAAFADITAKMGIGMTVHEVGGNVVYF